MQHLNCHVLTIPPAKRCQQCRSLRVSLRVLASRQQHASTKQKFTRNTNLPTPLKLTKLSKVGKNLKATARTVRLSQGRIRNLLEKQIDPSMDQDLLDIMREQEDEVKKNCGQGTFRRLFWEEQAKALKQKDARGRRWHPIMIKWWLNLKMMSSSAYHALRSSGCLELPSERTLRDFTGAIKTKEGFTHEVLEQLYTEVSGGTDSIQDHKQ